MMPFAIGDIPLGVVHTHFVPICALVIPLRRLPVRFPSELTVSETLPVISSVSSSPHASIAMKNWFFCFGSFTQATIENSAPTIARLSSSVKSADTAPLPRQFEGFVKLAIVDDF